MQNFGGTKESIMDHYGKFENSQYSVTKSKMRHSPGCPCLPRSFPGFPESPRGLVVTASVKFVSDCLEMQITRFPRIFRLLPSAATVWKNKSCFTEPFIVRKMSQTSVHPIAESGYSTPDTSQLYDRVRPSYSNESVNFLLEKLGVLPQNPSWDQPIRVLELGTGTGKFTRTLQEVLRGSNVQIIASEPLLSMREKFTKNFPDIEIKDFSAENIGKGKIVIPVLFVNCDVSRAGPVLRGRVEG